jgi:hypothetical protein
MGFLTSLVPGIRELRIPLTVGVMWLVVGWLEYPRLPRHLIHNQLVERLQHIHEPFGLLALAPLLAFAAYSLGMLMQPIGRLLQMLWMAAAAAPLLLGFALLMLFVIIGIPAYLIYHTWGIVLLIPAAIAVWYRKLPAERRHGARMRRWLWRMTLFGVWAGALGRKVWSIVPRAFRQNYLVKRMLIIERLDLVVKTRDARAIQRLLDRLGPRDLQILVRRTALVTKTSGGFSETGKRFDILDLLRMQQLSKEHTEALREFVSFRFRREPNVRHDIFFGYADLRDMNEAINREIDRAVATMRAKHEKNFEDYDRLSSEADLRSAVCVPIGLIVLLAIIIAFPFSAWYIWLYGGFVPMLILFGHGASKDAEAQYLLLSYILAGLYPIDEKYFGTMRRIPWKGEGVLPPGVVTIAPYPDRQESELALTDSAGTHHGQDDRNSQDSTDTKRWWPYLRRRPLARLRSGREQRRSRKRLMSIKRYWRGVSRELRHWRRWRTRTRLSIFCVITGGLFALFGGEWWPTRYSVIGSPDNPDATVMISTLILIYTFFIAAYGTLTPMVVAIRDPWWRSAILVFMSSAVVLDLFRILNSTADLYRTTMRHMDAGKVHDAEAEFARYFIANAIIVGIALWWVSRQRESTDRRRASRSGRRLHGPGHGRRRVSATTSSTSWSRRS